MLEDEPYDESVDWWSFGVLMYRLLTGEVCIIAYNNNNNNNNFINVSKTVVAEGKSPLY